MGRVYVNGSCVALVEGDLERGTVWNDNRTETIAHIGYGVFRDLSYSAGNDLAFIRDEWIYDRIGVNKLGRYNGSLEDAVAILIEQGILNP